MKKHRKDMLTFGATLRFLRAAEDALDYQRGKAASFDGKGVELERAERTAREWAFLVATHPDAPDDALAIFRKLSPVWARWEKHISRTQG